MGCVSSKESDLKEAARSGNVEACRKALAAGADPNGTAQVRGVVARAVGCGNTGADCACAV
jgi:hypothetical protein